PRHTPLSHLFFSMLRPPPRPPLFPYTTLFRSLSSPERIPHTNPRRLPTRGCSGKTSSGDGEDHQAKTSQEYSTEYRCSGGRAGLVSHNVHPPALEQVEQREIGQKQHHEDFAAVEIQEADDQGQPRRRS